MAQKRDADVEAAALPGRWERNPDAALGFFASSRTSAGPVHLYAGAAAGEAILDALSALPALQQERDRLRRELDQTREERDEARAQQRARARDAEPATRRPAAQEAEAELGAMISAPFRVSAAAAAAARTEPLAALAVQVARALSAEAKDIERARLIAMAFAATRGDLDAFWSARKQRATNAQKGAVRQKSGGS